MKPPKAAVWWTIGAAAALVVLSPFFFTATSVKPIAPRAANRTPHQAWEEAQPHLQLADKETGQALQHRLAQVDAYFTTAATDGRLQRFADEVLSLTAKFKCVSQSRSDFSAYVAKQFEKIVFSESDVRDAMVRILNGYSQDLDAADNKLLVAIETDAEMQTGTSVSPLPTLPQMQEHFADTLKAAGAAAIADVPVTATREALNLVVMQVVADVAADALASAGVIGTGTSIGATGGSRTTTAHRVANFGFGLAAGVAFDYLFTQITDPQGKLATTLRSKLDGIRRTTVGSIRAHLEELARRRSAVRRQLVAQTIGVTP